MPFFFSYLFYKGPTKKAHSCIQGCEEIQDVSVKAFTKQPSFDRCGSTPDDSSFCISAQMHDGSAGGGGKQELFLSLRS